MPGLRGAVAAALTPLREGGARLDEDAFAPYVDFLAAGGLDGVLALGTTGEGILFSVDERARAVELFVAASRGRLQLAAHCGAQTTADTVELARRAAETGVDAVAVIGPPYFKLDAAAQLAHLEAAAAACAPVPFYVYEFATTAGYPFAVDALLRLREQAENFRGLKVSDTPWEAFSPYLLEGLDVFAGPEALIHRAIEAGAVGAVSGLASVFPAEVAAVVHAPTAEGAAALGERRAALERFPRHAAFKRVLGRRGVPVRPDVRAPLRPLTDDEERDLDAWLERQ
jgi:dihydrodipicolinate synthase/N-acetylneuraminate lyase